ncbi:MAG: phosphoadenylyl-sulfate reductase [Bacteroidales bacterium]|nr:phosphoadenylyl-sulfate reductase [Bacteroidales bacterium]
MKEQVDNWNKELSNASPEEVIRFFNDIFGEKLALSSSLGAEDQVLTHMYVNTNEKPNIFTLDTGRLFPETYKLIAATNNKYNIKLKIYFPNTEEVEQMVNNKGIDPFFESIENRKLCCNIRKLGPLKRAFSGLDAWICGLRRDQAVTRFATRKVEWDEVNNIIKINPLNDWSEEDVWNYIKSNNIPYNELHDKGFPSIGCEPCTRAVKEGEDVRAGRWWWEQPESKECGLHNQKK